MPSRTLLPPTIASSLPAFITTGDSSIRIPISFSKFNNVSEFTCAHISLVKKDTGMNVINTEDDESSGRYRATGIILNVPVLSNTVNGDTTYYVEINASDLKSKYYNTEGGIPGWFYKVQVRLSATLYDGISGQQAWLNANAGNFSEWSTVCIIKAIGNIKIAATSFDYTYDASNKNANAGKEIYGSTLAFSGTYGCDDVTESLAFYRIKIYDYPKISGAKPLDDSGYIYNSATDINEFNYTFKMATPSAETAHYLIEVEYNTLNGYNDEFDIDFTLSQIFLDPIGARVATIDNDLTGIFEGISWRELEEDEGRIALKLYAADSSPYSGNLCVRRASSRDNFTKWEDVRIVTFKQQPINNSDIWYDYAIESGVWYKYGVQAINEKNERSEMNQTAAIIRNFNYSFLLGQNDKQLKLQFDNTMGSFKRNIVESHTDTIGGKYTIFSRNAATDYKTFPINGLISFWMDENNTFTTKADVYGNADVASMYSTYNAANNIVQYDFNYEREFRQKVSDFLHDGEIKIFKSPTEGNVLVRLSDISMTPNQSLDRMIYSFSANAYEIAENSVDNYKKYKFLVLKEVETDFSVSTLKIGQVIGEFNITDNIFDLIREKYTKTNVVGYDYAVGAIKNLRIQIDEQPMRIVNNSSNYILGHNLRLNGNLITLRNDLNVYEVDENVEFSTSNSLYLLGDADGRVKKINAVIDFLFDERVSVYEPKKISSRATRSGIGQIYGVYDTNTSLYQIISNKYYYDWDKHYSRLSRITGIEIESDPGAVFQIQDETEQIGEYHTINATGLLVLTDISNITQIRYIGTIDPETGEVDTTKKATVMLNYYYVVVSGGYQ